MIIKLNEKNLADTNFHILMVTEALTEQSHYGKPIQLADEHEMRTWDECTALNQKRQKKYWTSSWTRNKRVNTILPSNTAKLAPPEMDSAHGSGCSCLKRHIQGWWLEERVKTGRGFAHLGCARLYTKGGCVKGTLFALFHGRFTATLWSEVILLSPFYSWDNWGLKGLRKSNQKVTGVEFNLTSVLIPKTLLLAIAFYWTALDIERQHCVRSPHLHLENHRFRRWGSLPKAGL